MNNKKYMFENRNKTIYKLSKIWKYKIIAKHFKLSIGTVQSIINIYNKLYNKK